MEHDGLAAQILSVPQGRIRECLVDTMFRTAAPFVLIPSLTKLPSEQQCEPEMIVSECVVWSYLDGAAVARFGVGQFPEPPKYQAEAGMLHRVIGTVNFDGPFNKLRRRCMVPSRVCTFPRSWNTSGSPAEWRTIGIGLGQSAAKVFTPLAPFGQAPERSFLDPKSDLATHTPEGWFGEIFQPRPLPAFGTACSRPAAGLDLAHGRYPLSLAAAPPFGIRGALLWRYWRLRARAS